MTTYKIVGSDNVHIVIGEGESDAGFFAYPLFVYPDEEAYKTFDSNENTR